MRITTLRTSAKPYYGHGEHALYTDIVKVAGVLHSFNQYVRYQNVLASLEGAAMNASLKNMEENTAGYHGFMSALQRTYDHKAKVFDMFVPNGSVIN